MVGSGALDLLLLRCDSHFEAVGDAARPLDEVRCSGWRTKLGYRLFEHGEAAIEMRDVDPEVLMGLHRLSVIAAGHQRHLGQECAEFANLGVPIGDSGGKDRAQERIELEPPVEAPDELLDHDLVDLGLGYDLARETRAVLQARLHASHASGSPRRRRHEQLLGRRIQTSGALLPLIRRQTTATARRARPSPALP